MSPYVNLIGFRTEARTSDPSPVLNPGENFRRELPWVLPSARSLDEAHERLFTTRAHANTQAMGRENTTGVLK